MSFSLLITGIILIAVFMFKGKWVMFLVGLSRFTCAIVFSILGIYTSELYDTMIRATASGINNSVSRVGGVIMPFLLIWSFKLGPVGPFLFCGSISIIAAISGFLMPKDTTGQFLD